MSINSFSFFICFIFYKQSSFFVLCMDWICTTDVGVPCFNNIYYHHHLLGLHNTLCTPLKAFIYIFFFLELETLFKIFIIIFYSLAFLSIISCVFSLFYTHLCMCLKYMTFNIITNLFLICFLLYLSGLSLDIYITIIVHSAITTFC